jgi:hypothetical protein
LKTKLLFFNIIFLLIVTQCLFAGQMDVLKAKNFTVFYDPPLRFAAQEVVDMYPRIKADLEHIFGWQLNLKPSVVLIRDRRQFQRMAESPLTVAFAVPTRNLIVIDHSRMSTNPFNLGVVLKHELCHLLLHHHIRASTLPRWLDEGIAQWSSDGIADIVMDQKRSRLNRVSFRNGLIRLHTLEKRFPADTPSLSLAYEESKSFVTYMIGKFGKQRVLTVLTYMRQGENVDSAILKALSIPLEELEKKWHRSLRQKITWFTYISYHLYEILFAAGALITIYAFIRLIIRKRAYMKGEEDSRFYS